MGDHIFFAGLSLEVLQFKDSDILVQASSKEARLVTYGGQRMSMTTHLADRVKAMLAERFKVTQAVGEYKAQSGLPPADPGREDAQIARLRALAKDADLDPEFSEKFLRFIIDEVIRHHERAKAGS